MRDRELVAGRYEIGDVLGHGGMAEVRDGWDTRLDRAVAVKLLHPTLTTQPELRRRFDEEARVAGRLSHPAVVAVYDQGIHRGAPFIVMERLPGDTLAGVIARGPLPPQWVHVMLDDVLGALAAAHRAGVLHRDIKPANILISADREAVKVADFGIAKTPGSAHTATGQIIGTMAYMSPERVAGAPASVADDLYAVGVVAYEAVLGRRAFPHDHPAALARAIADTPPVPITRLRPDVGPVLGAVIDRAMARDPRQRFADAAQMRAAASGDPAALQAPPTPAPTTPPATRPVTRVQAAATLQSTSPPSGSVFPVGRRTAAGRRAAVLTAAGVVTAAAVSVLAVTLGSSPSAPPPEPVGTSASLAPPPPPEAAPTTDQRAAEIDERPGNGKGNGRGNGKGPGKGN
ncbi:MAG: serine/threonine-protein kinase [Actinomycetota bacterium]|nr:serine/threonine-protein kinase [Actinomycetota bacterium]